MGLALEKATTAPAENGITGKDTSVNVSADLIPLSLCTGDVFPNMKIAVNWLE